MFRRDRDFDLSPSLGERHHRPDSQRRLDAPADPVPHEPESTVRGDKREYPILLPSKIAHAGVQPDVLQEGGVGERQGEVRHPAELAIGDESAHDLRGNEGPIRVEDGVDVLDNVEEELVCGVSRAPAPPGAICRRQGDAELAVDVAVRRGDHPVELGEEGRGGDQLGEHGGLCERGEPVVGNFFQDLVHFCELFGEVELRESLAEILLKGFEKLMKKLDWHGDVADFAGAHGHKEKFGIAAHSGRLREKSRGARGYRAHKRPVPAHKLAGIDLRGAFAADMRDVEKVVPAGRNHGRQVQQRGKVLGELLEEGVAHTPVEDTVPVLLGNNTAAKK